MIYLLVEMKKSTAKEQDLIKSVVDNLPGLVFRVVNDGEWTFKFASHGASALLGYAPEELVTATAFRKMIPKEDQEENQRVLLKVSFLAIARAPFQERSRIAGGCWMPPAAEHYF